MADRISWAFYGYRTPSGRADVQDWFDSLPDEVKDEIRDRLAYLQKSEISGWCKPEFEHLGDSISEIRIKVSVPHLKAVYRIYGTFWPEGRRYSYTLLLGKDKKVNNDRHGKLEAIKRLKRLQQGEAIIHEFEFETGTYC
ncbi:MAG: type II toxin-antitoxin system RelE/ParE family toxin [Bryobacteraceae bacterium]|jgi:putative component of toxin-antitoxin plasmid stabilization module